MNDRDTLRTYILVTDKLEFYCGKTKNMTKRMKEHKNREGWFAYNERHKFRVVIELYGDYEKNIKSFGVEKFFRMIQYQHIKTVSLS